MNSITAAPKALINRVSVASVRQTSLPLVKKEETELLSPVIKKEKIKRSAAIPALPVIKKEKIKETTAESALEPLPALEFPPAVIAPTSKIDSKTSYRAVPAPVKALVASRAKSKVGITSTAALLFKTKSLAPYELPR
ncbi:hypothetical protein QBC32DRAFT_314661 [Pseudoneurospora amorphoporcata]|uniref:Uncharacterized protein n=1 Tax=Pseudoneurospora amorphoporcata TaxID=241081 RepID=A0AAN6SG15_9PEZI|nr:hypothetical protein QBC32DRAFT_314661 [Pseudoneurospora amorphoporcata]